MLAAYALALGIEIDAENVRRMPGYVVSERGGRAWQLVGRVFHGPTLDAVRRRYGLDAEKGDE